MLVSVRECFSGFTLKALLTRSHNDSDDRDVLSVCVWPNGLETGAGVSLYAFRNSKQRSEAEL